MKHTHLLSPAADFPSHCWSGAGGGSLWEAVVGFKGCASSGRAARASWAGWGKRCWCSGLGRIDGARRGEKCEGAEGTVLPDVNKGEAGASWP